MAPPPRKTVPPPAPGATAPRPAQGQARPLATPSASVAPASSPTPWPALQGPVQPLGARPSDRRAHPRLDLLAQVQVTRASEVYVLSTLNVSRGGLFLQCVPAEAPDLKVGLDVEVLIFAPGETIEDVVARARVARIDDGRAPGALAGFGLRFTQLDAENTRRLEKLIGPL
ncbi:MAG: PilZ domain-containing protein [Proteobacteria bacterium]|nr:PilZ domain-containing protein [Pseudomonadota bacterium]